jgi:hypothetical protein
MRERVQMIAAGTIVAIALVTFVVRDRPPAMPVFAQAYGLACTACQVQVKLAFSIRDGVTVSGLPRKGFTCDTCYT